MTIRSILLMPFFLLVAAVAGGALPDGVKSSQNPKDQPPTPQQSLEKIKVPDGFNVTLFAGEPDVAQPIAMAFDDRGRLWVAECYSYKKWQPTGHDRILIFEDADGDGRFDKRKVFAEKLPNLTGIELGFGGVWACCAPDLLFFADRDGDDRPDGEPEVKLTGWDTKKAGHNIVNGLTWGPDGWLYGLQGIQCPSQVGAPETPADERTEMNCGVWRYHPTRKKFEVVAHGTTNPWGLDFDQYGQAFFTNCVIGHLWHVIPGARYKRMYGQHFNPHLYGLLSECSDHLHWGGGKWTESRSGKGKHDVAGGGHAHVGAMIYLGDNWPDKYRGTLFTCNVHGNRVNNDVLQRKGSGYVARHGKDLFFANDPWFRGLELKYGPDGGVYITDWCDFGECHDNDGVHRTSGRIYKVTYGDKQPSSKSINLAELSGVELANLQSHRNAWFSRHARRLLQERAAEGRNLIDAQNRLLKLWSADDLTTPQRLRLVWSLDAIGKIEGLIPMGLLKAPDEHLRAWAVRWLSEAENRPPAADKKFAEMAADDPSPFVRLHLASHLQRLPHDQRWAIAEGLVQHEEDASDQNLPLMIWYGIEPLVAANQDRAIALAARCKIPLVRQYIARRAASK